MTHPDGQGLRADGVNIASDFDIAIRGGLVFDGDGADPVRADVGIVGDAIVSVGDLSDRSSERTVDASGRHVAPGFIDMHTHAERGLPYPELAPSVHHLKQGVTTVLGGAGRLRRVADPRLDGRPVVEADRPGHRHERRLMVGLGQVRRQVMGLTDREPTPARWTR